MVGGLWGGVGGTFTDVSLSEETPHQIRAVVTVRRFVEVLFDEIMAVTSSCGPRIVAAAAAAAAGRHFGSFSSFFFPPENEKFTVCSRQRFAAGQNGRRRVESIVHVSAFMADLDCRRMRSTTKMDATGIGRPPKPLLSHAKRRFIT